MFQGDRNNYVKLWRSILNNGFLMSDNNAYNVFTKLLMCVDRQTGCFTTGRYALAELCNMKPSTVRDVLKRLEREKMIIVEPDYSKSKIYICKWGDYQNSPVSSPSPARLQPVATTTLNKKKKQEEESSNSGVSKKQMDLLQVLNDETGRSFRAYPVEKRTAKTHLLFTPEEVRDAIRKMKTDEWHKPKMAQLKAGYILSTDNIDKFLNYKSVIEQSVRVQPTKTVSSQFSNLDVGMTAKERLAQEYA